MAFLGRIQFPQHCSQVMAATASLNPGAVTTGNTATATITVPGALVGDEVSVVCAVTLGNVIVSGEVTAANTVTCKFVNSSGGSITPAGGAANYTALVWRLTPEMFT